MAGGSAWPYGGTSLTRDRTTLGPYSRPMPRVLGGPGGGAFSCERGTPVHDIAPGFTQTQPPYRVTSLIRNRPPLEPNIRTMHRIPWWS